MLGACKKHPQAYFLYVEDCFLQSDNADARIFSKDKKTHKDGNLLLCVRFTVRKFVFNCEFVWTERVFMSLVACRLSLVACRKNYGGGLRRVKSFCKTFYTFFVRMLVFGVISVFAVFFYHYYTL